MMSSNEFTEIEQIEWENAAQRVFYDCLASSSTSSLSPLSSTTSTATVETLADCIEKRATGKYRNKHLLDGLRKSIEEFSSDGRVNFASFKEAAKRWVKNIEQQHEKNGNNIVTKDDSRSDDKKQRSANSSDNDQDFEILFGEPHRKNENSRKFTVTADFVGLVNVASYSPSSSHTTHGCAMSDTAPESVDCGCGIAVAIGNLRIHDLRMQNRQLNEQYSVVWNHFVESEELAAGLRRQLENLRTNFNQMTEKCRQLERKYDDQQELLDQMEKRERDCQRVLKKIEKEKNSLARKFDHAEAKKQQISFLESELKNCKKEKYDCIRDLTMCRRQLKDKQRECEMLEDQLALISEENKNFQESSEKSIQWLRDENHKLKYHQSVLRTPDTFRSPSDRNSPTTPTRRVNFYTSSPSCRGDRLHESLFEELKASEKSVDLSEIVPLPDAESTSNDSSSKIFAVQPNSKLSLSLTSIEPRTDVQTHHALSAVTEGNNANVSPVTVALAMSRGEDSSDSECDPMAIRENDNAHFKVGNETRSISPTVLNFVGGALLGTSTPASINNNNENCINNNNVKKPDDIPDHQTKESIVPKREKREDRLRQRNPVSQEELPSEDPR